MKLIIVFAALIVLATAAKKTKKPIAEYFSDFANEPDINLIIDDDNRPPTNFVGDVMKAKISKIKSLQGSKKFNFNYETENGISVASIGKLKDEKTFVVSGSYTYTGANGKRYRVRYTADEFGYHPVTELDEGPDVEIKPAVKPTPPPRPTFAPIPAFVPTTPKVQNDNKFDGYFIEKPYQTGKINIPQLSGSGQIVSGGSQAGFNGQYNGLNNGFNTINSFGSFDRTGKSLEQTDLAFDKVTFNKDFVSTSVYNEPNKLYLPANPTYLPPTQAPLYLPPTQAPIYLPPTQSPTYLPPYQQY